METTEITAKRQHITTAEDHPLLGVTAAGLKNLEANGFKGGDRVKVTVTLTKLPDEASCGS